MGGGISPMTVLSKRYFGMSKGELVNVMLNREKRGDLFLNPISISYLFHHIKQKSTI